MASDVGSTFGGGPAGVGGLGGSAGPDDPGLWLAERRGVMDGNEASWLEVLGEFDRAEGWAADGHQSGATWLMWKCGMARSTAYEKLRMARELRRRPIVAVAFGAGEISYSAARAICSIDDAEEGVDSALVDLAMRATIVEVESAVMHYQSLQDQERGGPDYGALERRQVRIWRGFHGLGQLRATLTNAELDEVEALLRAFGDRLDADAGAGAGASAGAGPSARADSHDGGTSRASAGADLSARADSHDGGTSRASAGADLSARVDSHGGEHGRFDDGRPVDTESLSAQADARGSVESAGSAGLDWRYTWGQARADALMDALGVGMAHRFEEQTVGADRYLVHVVTDAAGLAGDIHGRSELADGMPLAPGEAARICCDASFVAHLVDGTEPLYMGRRVRDWTVAQKRAIRVRDGGHCRFPGCYRRITDIHHVLPWEDGGATDVSNGACICRRHHTLLHAGFVAEGDANGALEFRRRTDRVVIGTSAPPMPKATVFRKAAA